MSTPTTEDCERCGKWTEKGAQPCLRCWPAIVVTKEGTTVWRHPGNQSEVVYPRPDA